MFCAKCGKKININAKFCNNCGKSVLVVQEVTNFNNSKIVKNNTDKYSEPVEKIKKEKIEIKGIGGWLSFFLFSLFVSIILNLFTGINDISGILETAGLTKSWMFSLVFLDVLYFGGIIAFIIYTIQAFSKLKENAVSLGKMYLILVFLTNLISVIFSIFTGEPIATETSYFDSSQMIVRSLVYGVIWFLYLIFSVRVCNTFPKENRKTKIFDRMFFFAIIAIPIVIYSLGFIGSVMPEDSIEQQSTKISSTLSVEDIIKETVKKIKTEMTLPNQLDEVTKLVDITAQPSAIRYHYILTDVDTTSISDNYFKNFLITGICQNGDTKNLLNQGIDMEYSYVVEGTTQKYFITINKADCL